MNKLTDLYYEAGGSAFHFEITEDIAINHLTEVIKQAKHDNEYSSDLESSNSDLEHQVSMLESDLEDMEADKDKLEDILTEIKEGLDLLRGKGKLSGRGSRLSDFLKAVKGTTIHNDYMSDGDIKAIIEALAILA